MRAACGREALRGAGLCRFPPCDAVHRGPSPGNDRSQIFYGHLVLVSGAMTYAQNTVWSATAATPPECA